MSKQQKKILFDSPEAASLRQVTGWVSSTGRFFGKDERLARFDGSTHKICEECGKNEHERGWTCCDECRARHGKERYEAMPFSEWHDGMVYSRTLCQFFSDDQEIRDHLAFHEIEIEDLMLVICEPQYAPKIEIDDLWCDYLPEDMYVSDVAPELAEAIGKFNDLIDEKKPILSWVPGEYRTSLKNKENKS